MIHKAKQSIISAPVLPTNGPFKEQSSARLPQTWRQSFVRRTYSYMVVVTMITEPTNHPQVCGFGYHCSRRALLWSRASLPLPSTSTSSRRRHSVGAREWRMIIVGDDECATYSHCLANRSANAHCVCVCGAWMRGALLIVYTSWRRDATLLIVYTNTLDALTTANGIRNCVFAPRSNQELSTRGITRQVYHVWWS